MPVSREKTFGCFHFHDAENSDDTYEDLFSHVEKSCIGNDLIFSGPFGKVPVTYCDYTASGRNKDLDHTSIIYTLFAAAWQHNGSLSFIEDYIRNEVLPYYANTHTTTSITSSQTTHFRNESRNIIRQAVHASNKDAVIFVSSGVTGAIHKLIHGMNLINTPIVFVSPYEHHSNLLPWKEIGAEIVWTAEDEDGKVCIKNLDESLKKYNHCKRPMIGSFSAASNVTGILTDVDAIATVLHKNGAIALFDYATAAPYVKIDMNPDKKRESYKDAVFISTHKFVGGPGTPGILIAKRTLFVNPVPTEAGGGTVISVTRQTQRYYNDIEVKEEGGTPSIVESIRAGLVFQLKEGIGAEKIMRREEYLVKKAHEYWKNTPNLFFLGDSEAERLPIFPFLIFHKESGKLLHHNFVCAVLNDVFGIQARGGCACAGPYAEDLLGLDEELAMRYANRLLKKGNDVNNEFRIGEEESEVQMEILKPGFSRLNLPFFMRDDVIEYILAAVDMVARLGWTLLPQYIMNPKTGEWRHGNDKKRMVRKSMENINYGEAKFNLTKSKRKFGKIPSYKKRLQRARRIFKKANSKKVRGCHASAGADILEQAATNTDSTSDLEDESLRWFLLPHEAFLYLYGKIPVSRGFKLQFTPRKSVKEIKVKANPSDEFDSDNSKVRKGVRKISVKSAFHLTPTNP